jgi:hypothetical protein
MQDDYWLKSFSLNVDKIDWLPICFEICNTTFLRNVVLQMSENETEKQNRLSPSRPAGGRS